MPIPILVLLSVVGFTVYLVVGTAIGMISARLMLEPHTMQQVVKWHDSYYRGWIIAGALLWPGWLAINVVFWSLFAVAVGPWWLCKHVGTYIGAALSR